MAFALGDDELLMQKVVREFARERIGNEAAERFDRHDEFPVAPLEAAAELGLMALGDAGPTAMALALDEVAQVCPSTAALLGTHNALGLRLLANGGLKDVVAAAVKGALVCTLATEEAHGPDKSKPGARAVARGEGFLLSGQKVWGLGAVGARHFLVLASAPKGPTWFHVPAEADGLVLGRNEALMGLRAAGVRTVYLSDVHVPAEAVVGEPGHGADLYAEALAWHQVATAACLNGCLAGALEGAARFAESRVQFGKPIGSYAAVSDKVADVDTNLAASRALTLAAAAALQADAAEARVASARAKLFAARTAVEGTRACIRVQGGTGFMRDSDVQRLARDARALQFVGEPDVVQRDLLRRHVLDLEFGPTP